MGLLKQGVMNVQDDYGHDGYNRIWETKRSYEGYLCEERQIEHWDEYRSVYDGRGKR